jgi:glyoxylase-like metal-dependent hydrolase (beta-lactamase superfamily II)
MQVLPGVYLVGGNAYYLDTRPFADSNAYVVDLGNEFVLIDCGFEAASLELIFENMRRWGLEPERLTHLLITHAHFDHSGNAQALRERGVAVVAHENEADGMMSGDERTIYYAFHRPYPCCAVDTRLRGDEQLRIGGCVIDAVHLPGHTDGCLAYALEVGGRRLLFTGDVIPAGAAPGWYGGGWNGGTQYDPRKYRASLHKLAKLPADAVFPGHGLCCLNGGAIILENALTTAIQTWGNR